MFYPKVAYKLSEIWDGYPGKNYPGSASLIDSIAKID
jgi:hypothetical protein